MVDGAWQFRRAPTITRPIEEIVRRTAEGIPFLVPEIQLAFKAKHQRPKDEQDFNAALPHLSLAQRDWLRMALEAAYGTYAWVDRLSSTPMRWRWVAKPVTGVTDLATCSTMPYTWSMLFVSYYRVSTDKQGRSGLGLEAQRTAVTAFTMGRGNVLAEFTEIESGKKNDRPQLVAALDLCRKKKARLVIAKLDRLARNVAFIANLMESGVEFIACDMPEANRLTLHILAAVAEHEREAISRRTKDALTAARARGTRLGNPRPVSSLARGRATLMKQTDERHANVRPLIKDLQAQGIGLRAIARELNRRGIPTARGMKWAHATVAAVLQRDGKDTL